VRAALIALVVTTLCASARANPSQQLDDANAAFRNGQLSIALEKYNALLYPAPKLARSDELIQAYVNLGVCRVDAGDMDGARREFEKALQLDANRQLDPLLVANKDAIRLFDDTKADIRNREREALDKQRVAELLKEREQFRASLRVYETHPLYLNFVPFGLGQFQNDDTLKGVIFAGTEGATFITSVSIWAYLADKYGINNQHLNVDRTTAQDIRTLQEIEVGSGIAFFGLWIYSAIDAYRNYEPRKQVTADDKLLPPNLRDLDKPKPKPKKTSWHLAPMITPNGAGLGVGWEN
jgi:tetratricopeptide (TPR) repeat protein